MAFVESLLLKHEEGHAKEPLGQLLKPPLQFRLPIQRVLVEGHKFHHPQALHHTLGVISPKQAIRPLSYHSFSLIWTTCKIDPCLCSKH
jgi:hypothetical protein